MASLVALAGLALASGADDCAPTIVLMGMARAGTSQMRASLGRHERVHIGHNTENWAAVNENLNPRRRAHLVAAARRWQARNYDCDSFRSEHRVASAPWLFAQRERVAAAHEGLPGALFVLMLRDPVERFASSFWHEKGPKRRADLPRLKRWAADVTRGDPRPMSHYGLRRINDADYYTLDVEGALNAALAAAPDLIVGFTEAHDRVVSQVINYLGLDAAAEVSRPRGVLKDVENNTSPRARLPAFQEILGAAGVAGRRQLSTERLARTLRTHGLSAVSSEEIRCAWRTTFPDAAPCARRGSFTDEALTMERCVNC